MKLIKGNYSKYNLTPNFRPFPFYFMKSLNGLYARYVEGVTNIDISKTSTLINSLYDFQQGESRLIVTFRHPTKHDPPILMRVIHTLIPRKARREGVKLNRLTHGHFVYGKWLITWANSLVRWLFPGIGAIPINNKSRDLESIRNLRSLMVNGDFPIFIAPEGQVTYHNEKCAPLESGVSSMALWCKEDLKKMKSDSRVEILPLSLHYDYSLNSDKSLNKLIKKLNRILGISSNDLSFLTEEIISRIEGFYKNFHFSNIEDNSSLELRIENLVEAILLRAESYFNIEGIGNYLERTLIIRQAGLSNIDFSNRVETLPGKDHGDHLASESYSILRHMEIADLLQYIDPSYIENGSLNRQIEYCLNLLDLVNRFNGGTIATRFSGIKKRVYIKTGNPIVVQDIKTRAGKREEGERIIKKILEELQTLSINIP